MLSHNYLSAIGYQAGVTDAAPERRLAGTSSSFRNPKKLATFGQPDP
jgi:hypothetical protein